jgi:hypothetical protein
MRVFFTLFLRCALTFAVRTCHDVPSGLYAIALLSLFPAVALVSYHYIMIFRPNGGLRCLLVSAGLNVIYACNHGFCIIVRARLMKRDSA